jgi:acetylornithine deacetylase
MKSFIAVSLALLPQFKAAGLKRPIHIAISYDEELGCIGVGSMIAGLSGLIAPPSAVLVGEPTGMQVVNTHKGCATFVTRIEGAPAHSSLPQLGANANIAAGRFISLIADMAEEKKASASPNCPFDPPYTTFNVGMIKGGTAFNIVPRHAEIAWEFRLLPGDDGEAILRRVREEVEERLLPHLRATYPEAQITTQGFANAPPLLPEKEGAAEALARQLTGANATGAVAYATEGGLFQNAGYSTVICGPGSIEQAHKADEFIAVSQVKACEVFLQKLAAWLAEPAA